MQVCGLHCQASQPVWVLQTAVWIDVRSRQSIRPTEGAAMSVGRLCQWMDDLSETGTVATVQPISQSINQSINELKGQYTVMLMNHG